MLTGIEGAGGLVYRAAMLKEQEAPFGLASAEAKLFASEVGTRCAHRALDILGQAGAVVGDHPSERILRAVKLCEIGEGTSEIQRIVISRKLLKEYERLLEPASQVVAEPVTSQ